MHGVWAMGCLAEIFEALGDAPAAAHAAAVHARAVADFNAVFWNATLRQYHDWIDATGSKRAYFYVDIAFVAVFAGVADAAQASALLDHYDARLAEIYSTLNVTPGSIWSAPSNLYPVMDSLEYRTSTRATRCPSRRTRMAAPSSTRRAFSSRRSARRAAQTRRSAASPRL